MNLSDIFKNRNQILEGLKNNLFKKDDVEKIAAERIAICRGGCEFYDPEGTSKKVVVKGKESCGNCGCNLALKTRCLNCSCPIDKWAALLTEEDVTNHYDKLNDTV